MKYTKTDTIFFKKENRLTMIGCDMNSANINMRFTASCATGEY